MHFFNVVIVAVTLLDTWLGSVNTNLNDFYCTPCAENHFKEGFKPTCLEVQPGDITVTLLSPRLCLVLPLTSGQSASCLSCGLLSHSSLFLRLCIWPTYNLSWKILSGFLYSTVSYLFYKVLLTYVSERGRQCDTQVSLQASEVTVTTCHDTFSSPWNDLVWPWFPHAVFALRVWSS